jgi:transposase-like protein
MPKKKSTEIVEEEKNKGGRPTKYTDETKERICLIIRGLSMQGKSLEDVAKILFISPATLRDWRDKYSAVSEALEGADPVNGMLLGKGWQMAMGYYYKEEYISQGGVVELNKYAKPDTKMMSLLLANRLKITDKISEDDNTSKPISINIYKGNNPDVEVVNE